MHPDPVEGRPLDDNELVARARNGDHAAFGDLVRRHQDMAHRTAWLITRSTQDAADATQSGFVKAYHALGLFRADAPFRPWLLAIVANEARNLRRSAARRAGLELRLTEGRASDDAAPSPEAAALAEDARVALVAALNALSERDRSVLACRYLLDLSEAETAAVLGCARGTVKSRVNRALGRLRRIVGEPAAQRAPIVAGTEP